MKNLTFNQRQPNLRLQTTLPPLGYALPLPRLAFLTTLQQVVIPVFPAVLTNDFLTSNGDYLTSDGEALQW